MAPGQEPRRKRGGSRAHDADRERGTRAVRADPGGRRGPGGPGHERTRVRPDQRQRQLVRHRLGRRRRRRRPRSQGAAPVRAGATQDVRGDAAGLRETAEAGAAEGAIGGEAARRQVQAATRRLRRPQESRREGVDGRRRRSPRVRVQLRAELPENPLEQEREGIRHEQEEE